MSEQKPIIGLSAPVAVHAAKGKPGPAKFTSVIYTGGPLRIAGYDLPVIVDLAGLQTGNVLVANLDHDSTKRVGNFEVTNDGQQLIANGTATAATAARDEVVNSARDGYRWQSSVEVEPVKLETLKRGDAAQVNGRTVSGPAYITRQGILKGFAFVTHGADDNTTVAIAAQTRARKMELDKFKDFMEVTFPSVNMELITAGELACFHANYHGRHTADDADLTAVQPMIAAAAPRDPVAAEQRRLRQIDAALAGDWGEQSDKVQEIKAQAVSGELSVDELLDELRPIRRELTMNTIPKAHTVSTGRRDDVSGRVIEAAMFNAVGLPDAEKHYSDQELQLAHDKFRSGIGLQQFLILAATVNGYRPSPGARITQGNLREVLQYAFPPIHAGQGFSTLSVSGLLSNIANKSLLTGWMEGDMTWRMIAQVKPATDFKEHTSYRMLDDMEYEEVGAGGEIKHGTASDESYTRQIATYAKMAAITRTQIINDDLGAFDDMRNRIGRGALTKFNKVFWAAFLNNSTFFSSGNSNVSTGSPASVLGTDGVGLQAAVLAFRKLQSADNKSIDGEPTTLLVPPELEFNARRLFQSTNIVATGDTDAEAVNANVYGGLYKPLIQRRLSDATFTGYSTTAWYLLRDPRIAAVVVASFLNGMESPTVDASDADFNTLGIQLRGYHDFGVDQTIDYLAGVRSAGA